MSGFGGTDLFGSGPHRFGVGERGVELRPLSLLFDNPSQAGSGVIGDREFEVVVTGRLVALTDSALWALRQAVAARASADEEPATLVDNAGRSFAGMSLVSYVEDDRVDRGRVWSVGYVCVFRRVG
ncbi:MAG: hypothetical protein CMJ31_13160 [Phycisphaerae bacterium]|nr:hypothetical protein [Phycisphaerae bacterium]